MSRPLQSRRRRPVRRRRSRPTPRGFEFQQGRDARLPPRPDDEHHRDGPRREDEQAGRDGGRPPRWTWSATGRSTDVDDERRRHARDVHRVHALGTEGGQGRGRLRLVQAGRPEQEAKWPSTSGPCWPCCGSTPWASSSRSRRARSARPPGSPTELPFKLVLPDAEPKPGDAWDRTYTIQLDPPLGTGEKYPAIQKYTCQEPKGGFLTVGADHRGEGPAGPGRRPDPALPLTPGRDAVLPRRDRAGTTGRGSRSRRN